MKKIIALFITPVFVSAFSIAQAQPVISAEPQSRTNNIGDNARFTVTATGSGTLTYKWKFEGTEIIDANSSSLDVLLTNANQAGSYTVEVKDDLGTTPSSSAVLSIPYGDRMRITQWNFNSITPDGNVATGTTIPSLGSGTIVGFGGAAADLAGTAAGSASDPASVGNDNSKYRVQTYPAATGANKSRGFRVDVSTLGYKDIVVTWEWRNTAEASKYVRLQYTINGTDWIDHTVHAQEINNIYFFQASDLSSLTGVKNNPSFAFRVTTEWESTAIGEGSESFVGTTAGYLASANMLHDMVTVLGTVDDSEEQPVILTQPQSQTNYVGGNVTLSVLATGGNLHYQWRDGNGDILNETNSALVLNDIQFSDAGTYSVFITNSAGFILSDSAVLTVEAALPPGDRFWSGDGAILGGAGTWNTTTPRWSTSTDGLFNLTWDNAKLDTANFNAPAGAVVVGEPITVNRINVIGAANYTFSGANRITFTNDSEFNNTSTASSAAVTFTAPLGAETLTKSGAGRMHLNNTGNAVDRFIATGGIISLQNGTSLGTTPAELVPDRITLDGAGLGFEGVAPSLSATRGITIGSNGGRFGVRSGGVVLTIHSPITGPGGILFPGFIAFHGSGIYGANETFVFNNPDNTYEGPTTVTVGELRLGADEVLPNTTTLTLNGTSGAAQRGRINLNGHHETVASFIASNTGAAVFDTIGGGTLTATHYDMRASRTGGGQNGINVPLAGEADLTKTTSAEVELGGANTYTGDTFLNEGKIILSGPGSFGNGQGTLHLAGGNIDLRDTRTEETVLLNPVVMTADAQIQSATTASGDVVFLSGGAWQAEAGTLTLVNGSASPGSTFTMGLTNQANFSAAIVFFAEAQLAFLNPAGTDQVFSNSISGFGSVRRSVLSGAGGRTVFMSENTYDGGTVIDAGTLVVNNPSGSGTGSGNVAVNGPGGVLGGTGFISGNVEINDGGSISPGNSVGLLTLQNGLNMASGGTMIWELAALKDSSDGIAGTDFDQTVVSGGELQLGGTSKLLLQFTDATTPNASNPFWQATRSWTIVSLGGGANSASASFASMLNSSQSAGNFSTQVEDGNIVLTFVPGAPTGPVITSHPQSRTSVAGTTARFTVEATGSGLTYEWFRAAAPFTPIAGATNATLAIANVQSTDEGSYFARVYGGSENATSSTAQLTVVPAPSVGIQASAGASQVVLTWNTVAGGEYQLQYNTNLATSVWFPVTNFVATGGSVTITNLPAPGDKERYYRLVIE